MFKLFRLNLSVQNTWLSSRFLYRIQAGYHSAFGISVPVSVTLGFAYVAAGFLLLGTGLRPSSSLLSLTPPAIFGLSIWRGGEGKGADLHLAALPKLSLFFGGCTQCLPLPLSADVPLLSW